MGVRFVNNFNALLAASLSNIDTTIPIAAGFGATLTTKLGAPLGTDHIYATLVNSANDIEIVKVTAISGDNLTVVRGVDNTTARPWLAGDCISFRANAAALMEVAYPTYESIYPIGTIYVNAVSNTNPATLLGFGAWQAFGSGQVLVGVDSTIAAFDTIGKTGGSKDAVVVSHTHTGTAASDGAHVHATAFDNTSGIDSDYYGSGSRHKGAGAGFNTSSGGAHTHTVSVSTEGVSGTDANLPPYITVYMWRRVS